MISGAHLYEFPSLDADYDLHGAHVPLDAVVGLELRDERAVHAFTTLHSMSLSRRAIHRQF